MSLSLSLAALAVPGSAQAAIDDRIEMADPAGSTQRLTVTMQDDTVTGSVPLVATYRAITPAQVQAQSCSRDLALNRDTRLIDEAAGPGRYVVRRQVDLPLTIHLVCLYRSGAYEAGAIVGTYRSSPVLGAAGKRQPYVARVFVTRTAGDRGRIAARIVGLPRNRGQVRLQRRLKGRWHTAARAVVRRGKVRRTVRLRKGQRWRVYVPSTSSTNWARSPAIRVR